MIPDYLQQIIMANSPEEAATLIRAFATRVATSVARYDAAGSLELLQEAERNAQTLERSWDEDSGPKPWRLWLREWGY